MKVGSLRFTAWLAGNSGGLSLVQGAGLGWAGLGRASGREAVLTAYILLREGPSDSGHLQELPSWVVYCLLPEFKELPSRMECF